MNTNNSDILSPTAYYIVKKYLIPNAANVRPAPNFTFNESPGLKTYPPQFSLILIAPHAGSRKCAYCPPFTVVLKQTMGGGTGASPQYLHKVSLGSSLNPTGSQSFRIFSANFFYFQMSYFNKLLLEFNIRSTLYLVSPMFLLNCKDPDFSLKGTSVAGFKILVFRHETEVVII